jgi:hypothetical protein
MLQDIDIKAVLTDASAFFKNYSQQSLNIQPMAQSLAQLNGRLDSVMQAITSATKQAERNAEASGKLAEKLNFFTYCWCSLLPCWCLLVFFSCSTIDFIL